VAGVVGLAAVQSPALTLAAVAAVAFFVASFRDLSLGVAGFTLLIFFENFAGSTGAAKGVGAALAVAWLFHLLARPQQTPFLLRDHPLPAAAAIVLVALAFASMLWADDPARTLDAGIRLVQVVLLFFITYSAARGPRELSRIAWAFATGAAAAGLVGLVTGSAFADTDRLSGGIQDPNFLAATQVAGVGVAAFFLFAPSTRAAARALAFVFVVGSLVALFETQSRGGILALAALLVFAPIVAGRLRVRAIVLALLVAGFTITYFAVFATIEARERVTSEFTEAGATGRSDSWSVALHVFGDNPVLGVGLANFPVAELEYTTRSIPIELVGQILSHSSVVHNSYLEPLSEIGPIGLAAFVFAVAGPLVLGAAVLRRSGATEPESTTVLRGVMSALFALLVAYFFLSGQYEKQLWLLAGLTAAAATVTASRARLGERGRVPAQPL
jgi:O-antigen ligase